MSLSFYTPRATSTLFRSLSQVVRRSRPQLLSTRGLATVQHEHGHGDFPISFERTLLRPKAISNVKAISDTEREAQSVPALVRSLQRYMGNKSGIDGTAVDIAHLRTLMARCKPDVHEWKKYGRQDPSRSYTRLHVDDINGRCNLLFLVWKAGSQSPIHNHANALCLMKIVKGTLNETVYNQPKNGSLSSDSLSNGPLSIQRDSFHGAGQVAFINDDIGIHRMTNPDQNDFAVSLHLYTPPHAADYGFSTYCPHTGLATHVPGRIALTDVAAATRSIST